MKSIISKISLLTISLCISMNVFTLKTYAADISQNSNHAGNVFKALESSQNNQTIVPYAHIIDWRYKSQGGKVYRRLYNYSREQWIGEWELC
ncbi:MAG TPA: hypothetical protein GX707_06025 [Epulopiscium sp.]|nr:hypothetical protein [Candidatus Epulonipiscium sp.]